MKNKISVTIGIPAHNEEKNIFNLIDSLLTQETSISYIENIIIIYSGHYSVETSNKLREKYQDKIILITDSKRTSKINKLNRISKLSQSEVTLILDGDIIIPNKNLVEKLSTPFMNDKDLLITTPVLKQVSTKNLLQKILVNSNISKQYISNKWNNGDNYIKAIGRSLAYRTSFLKNNNIPEILAEDFFLYIKAKVQGGKIKEISDSEILFHLPKNLKDHISQSSRFLSNKNAFREVLDRSSIKKYVEMPLKIKLFFIIKSLSLNPIYSFLYILLLISSKIHSIIFFSDNANWKISQSTKYD